MANFGKDLQDRCVHIRSAEQNEHFTVYIISVTVGSYAWTVKHRYSEFHDLHERLSASYKLDKTLLPPKKLFGNQTEAFIKKRQKELEIYLQTIILCLAQHIPSSLAYFLDFDKYEIHGITQAMAEDLYNRGESLLQTKDQYEVTSLQLYSLTERLKLPEPTCDSGDLKKDLGHILDFITRSKHLKVVSGKKPVGTSNIIMNKLPFDLTLFKSLQTLEITGCNFRLITGLETVKQTLTRFDVHESSSSLKEILLQDAPHWKAEDGSLIVGYWDLVVEADLSRNSFSDIPDCIQLMPNIEKLNLGDNLIESIQNLQWLSQLTHLDLSHNNIKHVDSLHTKMGNVKVVRVAHNRLESLHGFAKLFSLETLDVSFNKIASIDELRYVSQLPCVEDLLLVGNAVTNALDYRTKTLEMFGDRVREIVLDNQPPDQKELDTVAVLQALRKAKDVKITKRPKKNPSVVSLSEYGQCSPTNSLNSTNEGKVSRTESPLPGVISRSVPSASDWSRKEQHGVLRSSSPCSQESISSQSDVHEAEVSHDGQSQQPPSQTNAESYFNTNNNSDSDGLTEVYAHELVPEAHPFDLGSENPASYTYSPHLSTPKKTSNVGEVRSPLTTGTSPQPALVLASAKALNLETVCSPAVTKSGSEPLEPKAVISSSDLSHSLPAVTGPSEKRKLKLTYNVSDLPTTSSEKFVAWLSTQLFGDMSPTFHPGKERMRSEQESVLDILWCYVEQLSKPNHLHPCCVVVTKSKIFIEEMVAMQSCYPAVPVLRPLSIMPIGNIQQVVIGPCHAYLRLEEAFVGKCGTFTLLAVESLGLRRFLSKLQEACLHLHTTCCPEYVNLSHQSDLLDEVITLEEKCFGMPSDRLSIVLLIRVKDTPGFCLLVLSENCVYCLNPALVHWPPASFETDPEESMKFEVCHQFSIVDAIFDIKIHPIPDCEVEDFRTPGSGLNVDFKPYELSLEVSFPSDRSKNISTNNCSASSPSSILDLGQRKNTSICYMFPSSAHRDVFLDRLTCLRAEQANRMSPTVREEPEGGNELQSLTDNNLVGKVISTLASKRLTSNQKGVNMTKLEVSGSTNPLKSIIKSSETESEIGSLCSNKSNLRAESASNSDETYQDDTASLDRELYYSASPKDDLSVSPMSNFSRASISPPAGQLQGQKKPMALTSSQKLTSIKADSLPSSFDWKEYYFQPAHSQASENFSENAAYPSSSRTASMRSNLHIKIPGVLEDLESSAEYNPTSLEETEHELYLRQCVRSYDLINPLPRKLKPLCLMNGRELLQFFRNVIAQNSADYTDRLSEELHHVLWSVVIPYTNPKQEIVTLIMLSTHNIYLVSDTSPQPTPKSRPSWMTHSRNRSDSAISWTSQNSGYVSSGKKPVTSYFVFRYGDLQQVNIGLFDQCVRLTGNNEKSVFTIATRDSTVTEVFIQKLKYILSFRVSSPMVDKSKTEIEQDFYGSAHQRVKSTLDGMVYTHPSKVNFVYPGEDSVHDILYLVKAKVTKGVSPKNAPSSLWFYMQCYQILADERGSERNVPRTFIVTQTHICLAEEDSVTYPLPDFVRGLPENPCHEMKECRSIDCLKRVTLSHSNYHFLSLTFSEEVEDIVVDVSVEHFSPASKGRLDINPEFTFKFYVQSLKERDKCIRVLEKLWKQLVSQVGLILDVNKV
ncbi:nischarin isoform X2 [Biomphalaria glabrata]|nr:nischarin isoform X2 [Biomphalaria glabrata]